jgi:hypothetical protein
MGESKRRLRSQGEGGRETDVFRIKRTNEGVALPAHVAGWRATNAERAVGLDEFCWGPGEQLTLQTFGVATLERTLDQGFPDWPLMATIVEQALAWINGPPTTAPQCCICGRTFLKPVGPVRPEGPCFAFLRKGQRDDGVVMAMLYCSEHVRDGEYDDALVALVEDRLGFKPGDTGRA